jgi:hypothetical protein
LREQLMKDIQIVHRRYLFLPSTYFDPFLF